VHLAPHLELRLELQLHLGVQFGVHCEVQWGICGKLVGVYAAWARLAASSARRGFPVPGARPG